MPRYSLRTLLILLAIGPPLIAVVWLAPWFVAFVVCFAALLAVYLVVLPYCLAWLISAIAALIRMIPGQD